MKTTKLIALTALLLACLVPAASARPAIDPAARHHVTPYVGTHWPVPPPRHYVGPRPVDSRPVSGDFPVAAFAIGAGGIAGFVLLLASGKGVLRGSRVRVG